MSGEAVLENVRRYRAIASLCRQTAAFRPEQKWSLLQQAEDWERRAISEIEDCLQAGEPAEEDEDPRRQTGPRSTRDGGCRGGRGCLPTSELSAAQSPPLFQAAIKARLQIGPELEPRSRFRARMNPPPCRI